MVRVRACVGAWVIRWFQSSVVCLQSVRDQCPTSLLIDDMIDAQLRPHLSLYALCTRRNLYEGSYVLRLPAGTSTCVRADRIGR